MAVEYGSINLTAKVIFDRSIDHYFDLQYNGKNPFSPVKIILLD